MAAIAELGRFPEDDEFARAAEVAANLVRSSERSALVMRVTAPRNGTPSGSDGPRIFWSISPCARFSKRPPLGQLPRTLQRDMRAFFGTYTKACQRADELLYQRQRGAIDEACHARR